MGRPGLWENDTDKNQACIMRKQINPGTGKKYTNFEIMTAYALEGKDFYRIKLGFSITPISKKNKLDKFRDKKNEPVEIDENLDSLSDIKEINESLYKRMLLNVCKAHPDDLGVVREVRDYLKATEGFETKKSDLILSEEDTTTLMDSGKDYLDRVMDKSKQPKVKADSI